MTAKRTVEVPSSRLSRWITGFGDRHGGAEGNWANGVLQLRGTDGSTAQIQIPFLTTQTQPDEAINDLVRAAEQAVTLCEIPRLLLVLLVRRGGYAVGLVKEGQVLAHSVGRRYVQSRTAAGGWSQQRFARRRTGQAAALVDTVVGATCGLLLTGIKTPDGELEGLITGGDKPLIEDVLTDPRLRALTCLPRGNHLDVPDPRLTILKEAAVRAQAAKIVVVDTVG